MLNESTNIVDNAIEWDGNTNTWQPPLGYLMFVKATTPAMVWQLDTDKTNYVLTEVVGAGWINFTWNGSVLTTNDPQPAPVVQPATTGTQSA